MLRLPFERLIHVLVRSKDRLFWCFLAAAAWICAGAVMFDSVYLTTHFFQPLFVWDSWETVKDLKAVREGTYTLSRLFSQHNEHRIAVPRLVFFADYEIGHGLNIINVSVIYLIQSVHAALLIAMAASRLYQGATLMIVSAAIVVLLFSFGQHDNLTSGFQVSFVGVYAAATAACLAAAVAMRKGVSDRLSAIAIMAAMLAATIAAYMMSNGVLAPLIMVGFAVVTRAGKALLASTVIFATAILFAYFHGGHFGQVAPPLELNLVQRLGSTGSYVLIYIGGVAGSLGLFQSGVLGFIGIVLAIGAAVRQIRLRETAPVPMALLGVMAFVLGTAAVTAWGRVGFGLPQALSNRYMTPSAVFWSAQLVYWAAPAQKAAGRTPLALLLVLAVTTMTCAVTRHLEKRQGVHDEFMNRNLAADMLLSGVVVPNLMETIYPNKETVVSLTPFLSREKLNIFALPEASWRGARLRDAFAKVDDRRCEVVLDLRTPLYPTGAGLVKGMEVRGWAWDRLRRRPVDRIVLVGPDQTVVGFASGGWWRPDWGELPAVENAQSVGWKGFARSGASDALRPYAVLDQGQTACGGR